MFKNPDDKIKKAAKTLFIVLLIVTIVGSIYLFVPSIKEITGLFATLNNAKNASEGYSGDATQYFEWQYVFKAVLTSVAILIATGVAVFLEYIGCLLLYSYGTIVDARIAEATSCVKIARFQEGMYAKTIGKTVREAKSETQEAPPKFVFSTPLTKTDIGNSGTNDKGPN